MPTGLTLSHGGHLILECQDQLGLSSEVLTAALLVLQHSGDAPRQVMQTVDHRWVRVGLQEAIQTQSCTKGQLDTV
jgi:hypothetical protein